MNDLYIFTGLLLFVLTSQTNISFLAPIRIKFSSIVVETDVRIFEYLIRFKSLPVSTFVRAQDWS